MHITGSSGRRLISAVATFVVLLALLGPSAGRPAVAAAQTDDAADGELTELWTFDTGDSITSDPFVVDGIVYVLSNDGVIHAVDASTGEERWQAPTAHRDFEPAVADGVLFTAEFDEETGAGRLIALDVASAGEEERWAAEFEAEPVGRPVVTESGLVLVSTRFTPEDGAATSRLVALDLEEGAEQWSVVGANNFFFADETIWFTAGTQLLALDADGRLRWIDDLSDPVGRLFYRDGVLYGGFLSGGRVFARDGATGASFVRTVSIDEQLGVVPLAVDERTLYLGNAAEADNDMIVAVDLGMFDEEQKEARWIVDGVPGLLADLVPAGGFVYVGTNKASDDDPGTVLVLDAETGETVAQADVPAFAVTVADGVIYTGWGDGVLHAFADPAAGGELAGSAEQPSGAGAALDLAAMTLTPQDLAEAGLDGYGLGFAETTFPAQVVASTAAARDLDEDEVADVLAGAGFARRYEGLLYLPEDEDDPTGPARRMVASYVLEFADADGAEAAFAFLEDETASETAEDLEDAGEIGDQSEVTSDRGEDPASGAEYAMLDLTFRIGNLHAGVALIDWEGEEPDPADVEALAARLLERVEGVVADGSPGLGAQVLRLTGDGIVPAADHYLLLAGESPALSEDAAGDAREREAAAEDLGQTDAYRLWQQLAAGEADAADDVWYLAELIRFADEEAAADWLAGTEDRVTANDAFEDQEMAEDVPDAGDEVVGYTYSSGDAHFRGLAVRVGATVALLDVYGPATPPAAALDALAEAQAACLEDAGCPEPLELPDDLAGFVAEPGDADRGGGEEDDRDETPEAGDDEGADTEDETADAEGETYVSPTWGYSVTWDPDSWEAKERPDEDGIELQLIGGFVVGGSVRGVEGYDGDPEACLAGMVADAEERTESPVAPADDLPAPETADEAAGELLVLGDFGVVYYECRPLGDGDGVLQVSLGAPVGDYEAVLPAFEELLTGIEAREA